MRTVPYKQVVEEAFELAGIPSTEVNEAEAAGLTTHVNRRMRKGWEFFPWPETMETEERFFRDAWSSSIGYAAGDEVRYVVDGEVRYFEALLSMSDIAVLPGTNESAWGPVGDDFERYVEWEQTGLPPLGTVYDVFAGNPRTRRYVVGVGYETTARGVELPPGMVLGPSVWVRYQRRAPRVSASTYDVLRSYAVDDLVYQPEDGHAYRCVLAAPPGNSPEVAPERWEQVGFPHVLAHYCAVGAYVDHLRPEGQEEKAVMGEGAAAAILAEEIEKAEGQSNQGRRMHVQGRAAAHC